MARHNAYIQFCQRYRQSTEWKARGYHRRTVPEQGRILGAIYRSSKNITITFEIDDKRYKVHTKDFVSATAHNSLDLLPFLEPAPIGWSDVGKESYDRVIAEACVGPDCKGEVRLYLEDDKGKVVHLRLPRDMKRVSEYTFSNKKGHALTEPPFLNQLDGRYACDHRPWGAFATRPGPSAPAKECSNARILEAKGNDGKTWVVHMDKNGKHQWKRKAAKPSASAQKS